MQHKPQKKRYRRQFRKVSRSNAAETLKIGKSNYSISKLFEKTRKVRYRPKTASKKRQSLLGRRQGQTVHPAGFWGYPHENRIIKPLPLKTQQDPDHNYFKRRRNNYLQPPNKNPSKYLENLAAAPGTGHFAIRIEPGDVPTIRLDRSFRITTGRPRACEGDFFEDHSWMKPTCSFSGREGDRTLASAAPIPENCAGQFVADGYDVYKVCIPSEETLACVY